MGYPHQRMVFTRALVMIPLEQESNSNRDATRLKKHNKLFLEFFRCTFRTFKLCHTVILVGTGILEIWGNSGTVLKAWSSGIHWAHPLWNRSTDLAPVDFLKLDNFLCSQFVVYFFPRLLFSGMVSTACYTATHIFLLGSFIVMQCFVEWDNYQLKKCQTMLSDESRFSVKKTGAVTLMVVSVASSHLTLMFLFSDESKTHGYYLLKVCKSYTF